MPNNGIFFLLGWPIAALAGLTVVPIGIAINAQNWNMAGAFAMSLVVFAFLGGLFIASFRGAHGHIDRSGVVAYVLLTWIVVSFLAAVPFLADDHFTNSYEAIFEAVSGLTTTGATVIGDLDGTPQAILAWRAILQWAGGLMSLLTAMVALAPLGVSGTSANVTIPGYERADLRHSIVMGVRHVMPVYSGLTLACMFMLWALDVPVFDAFCLALSTLSTGGFMVRNGGIAFYDSVAVEVTLMVFMLLGASSILGLLYFFSRPGLQIPDRPETTRMTIVALLAGLVAAALIYKSIELPSVSDAFAALRTGLFRAVSLVTTTGFDNARVDTPAVPYSIVILLCLMGGAAFSSAGGLKQYRFMILLSEAERELARLIHPHIVLTDRVAGHLVEPRIMQATWALLCATIAALCTITWLLAGLGQGFEEALMTVVGALTNTGAAIIMTVPKDPVWTGYQSVSDAGLMVLALAMIAGRLELLVLMAAFQSNFWRS